MTYGDFKDLNTKAIAHNKILSGKAFNIAKSPEYDRINVYFLQWLINFSIKEFR